MTRNDLIDRWKTIAECVFSAEHAIIDQWRDKMKEAAKKGNDEVERMKDLYLTAIATEILSRTSDEELEKMGGDL